MLCLSYWVSIHSETWQFSVETAKHLSWLILCLKGYQKVYDRISLLSFIVQSLRFGMFYLDYDMKS